MAKWPRTLRELHGTRARTTRQLRNGFVTIPAGHPVTITGGSRWNRLSIRGEACKCCGVAVSCCGVELVDLEPVE